MNITTYQNSDDLPGMYANREGVVYILGAIGKCKIGSTRNPLSRIRSIETTSGSRVVAILISAPCRNYKDIERSLHDTFAYCRIMGEWFRCEFWQAGAMLEGTTAIRSEPEALPGIEIAAALKL